jgi:hypothetical protein
MSAKDIRNLPSSVLARLLNLAKQTGDNYQVLLAKFVSERFLYRLGRSTLRERFVLKGAMLLQIWSAHPYRATRDLDLLRRGEGGVEAIRADVDAICATKVDPDGIEFDRKSIRYLAGRFEFDGATLAESIRRTFQRRRTPIPEEEPFGLTTEYWDNPARVTQIRAFARRANLEVGPDVGEEVLGVLRPFLLPILENLRRGGTTAGTWHPGGPWRRVKA